MTILLVGGGSGGHIMPLIAVARELKAKRPDVEIVAICEQGSKFADVYKSEATIDKTYQVSAGKLRRYPADRWWQKITDVKSFLKNTKDGVKVLRGYKQAKKLLKDIKPNGILFKGGYVGVPVGLAAAKLKIPFITHDSDTLPGLTNRIIGRWSKIHATGMPAEFYNYPKDRTVFTGTPIGDEYKKVTQNDRDSYKAELELAGCNPVVLVVGGSQGAKSLNDSFLQIAPRLMQQLPDLGVIHNAGNEHKREVERSYANQLLADERRHIKVIGFVEDIYRYSAAADLILTRSSATFMAEFAAQGKACIVVPGNLAGNHQATNAMHLKSRQAVEIVPDNDSEKLYETLLRLLKSEDERQRLAENLYRMAKPKAASELADLVISNFLI